MGEPAQLVVSKYFFAFFSLINGFQPGAPGVVRIVEVLFSPVNMNYSFKNTGLLFIRLSGLFKHDRCATKKTIKKRSKPFSKAPTQQMLFRTKDKTQEKWE